MQTQTTPMPGPQVPTPAGPDPTEQRRRALAIKRMRDKNAFRLHLAAYLVINACFVVTWAISGIGYFWPIFVMLGWGAGVAIHGYSVYGGNDTMAEAQIEREMKPLP